MYKICIIYRPEEKKLKELLMVAKEVSVMQKREYVWKMHNLQIIDKQKMLKIVMG